MAAAAGRGTAVVTGASGGIGLGLARELAARGWDLAPSARSEGKLAAAAEDLSRVHRVRVEVFPADLATAAGMLTAGIARSLQDPKDMA